MMRVDLQGKSFSTSHILGAIAFDVGETEAVAMTGPSGIGKSTLLRCIAGLDTEFDGSITGAGRVAFVFQEPTLLPWRTARDNLVLAANLSRVQADKLLARVGLADKAEHFPAQLSLGQRRRIAIIRAFAREPQTLLMDEPFASLDSDAASEIRVLLAELLSSRPTRLILVTHDASEAEALADRIIRLEGTPAVVVDQSVVRN